LEYAARHNFHVSQNLDVDEVIAEKFELYRSIWRQCGHAGPMPHTFLSRWAQFYIPSAGVATLCEIPNVAMASDKE
jgi:hypothetical protein